MALAGSKTSAHAYSRDIWAARSAMSAGRAGFVTVHMCLRYTAAVAGRVGAAWSLLMFDPELGTEI